MATTTSIPVEAVIFDLDGTLLDHDGSVAEALRAWLPELRSSASGELIEAWLQIEDRHLPAWRAGHITFAEQRRRRLRDFLPMIGADFTDDTELDDLFAGYLAHYEASWSVFDDVDDTLMALAETSLAMAVLTNGTVEQQNAKLAAVGLTGRVGRVFVSEAIGAAKPDPSTYRTVCAELGVRPAATLHVGDRHDLDVLAPRAIGLQAIHLDRHDRGPHDEPHRIRSLRELDLLSLGGTRC